MMYKCQRCLKRMGIKKMVDIEATLPNGRESITLCTSCYEDFAVKIRPESNYYALQEKVKKAFKLTES